MYQCFHCLADAVVWDSDIDFEDLGYEGKGIVHMCHCTNCGAEIEYRVPIKSEEDGLSKTVEQIPGQLELNI